MKSRPEFIEEEVQLLGLYKDVTPEEMESVRVQALKALESAAGQKVETEMPIPQRVRSPRRWEWPAVAMIAAAIVLAVFLPTRIVQSAPAVLEDADGKRKIQYGEVVRPAGDMSAMLAMADGPRVEMRSMSEFSLERTDDGGTRIHLNEGGLIVDAASQRSRNLYVQTKDITALVSGTVSLVKAEEEGSRVAAIGGQVRVQQGATEKTLRPGEQVATNPKMDWIPVKEEVTWSNQALIHIAMLEQASATRVSQTPRQNPREEKLAFEVATIRPSAITPSPTGPGARGGGPPGGRLNCALGAIQLDPRRFTIRRATVYELAALAYGRCGDFMGAFSATRISGGSGWVKEQRWDIEAVIPEGAIESLPTGSRGAAGELVSGRSPGVQQMIRTLLEERFKVSVRREMKETAAYVVAVGPNGTKFQGSAPQAQPVRPDGRPGPQFVFVNPAGKPLTAAEGGEGIMIQLAWRCNGNPCSTIMATNQEMASVTNTLSGLVGRAVLDRTGIQEKVSFNLEWPRTPAPYVEGQLPPAPTFQDLAKAFEAVGLQLKEDPKGQVETLVIERAEKPSEN